MDPDKPAAQPKKPWHFEAPLDRRALRVRAVVATGAAVVLCGVAARASSKGAFAATLLGIMGAVGFGVLAYVSLCMSRIRGAPLVLDEAGMSFEDGLGPRSFLPWEAIDEIGLRRSRTGRRIVVKLRDGEAGELSLPAICCSGAPPEWTAGLIETFRHRALHRQ